MNIYKRCFLSLFLFSCVCCTAETGGPENTIATCNRYATDTLPLRCPQGEEIEKIISEAISLGAPVYNEGLHMACYRIYEWAAYKILYVYGTSCKNVETVLKTAIEKSHGDYSDTEKAWIMRVAFDKILGVPTQKNGVTKELPFKNG